MGEHLVLHVERLVNPRNALESEVASSSSSWNSALEKKREGNEDEPIEGGEDEPLIQIAECRICQEEESVSGLEVPCGCSGSVKVFPEFFFVFNSLCYF